ncbi:MAG: adenylate/guanylate cyclase domain-containing protein [Pseudomonadota bacterium]|nr:adenylate/guanylate cyclase domain-containing protein [Gammaproteobacteria bacterium]MDQ3583208.1 adenylate/guanylate cyclase domain-containing protein [Pseudomonadota bacterium]
MRHRDRRQPRIAGVPGHGETGNLGAELPSVAIMFADISGSTRLYGELGDVAARDRVAECLDAIAHCAQRHGGRVVKTIGDEAVCIFASADLAVMAAWEIQGNHDDEPASGCAGPAATLSVRVGLHFGPVILEADDLFGQSVNVAKRAVDLAKPEQIIITAAVFHELSPPCRSSTRIVDRVEINGEAEPLAIFEVVWREDDSTGVAGYVLPIVLGDSGPDLALVLRCQGREFKLEGGCRPVTLGRGPVCDLVVDDHLASRRHLRIECRRGRYYLVDHSTNGTYVRSEGGGCAFVRRDETVLQGCGQVSLGRTFGDPAKKLVFFEIAS